MQLNPHAVPLHVAVAFAGGMQGLHEVPHELVLLLLTHASPQRWKPGLQVNPHAVPSHVAVALAGGAHGAQLFPQVFTLLFGAHAPPHAW